MAKSPILGGFSIARSKNLADNDLVNLIVEIVETKDGKAPGALYNSAGLDLLFTVGSGPVRGVRDLNDLLYVVSGGNVYSLTANGTVTLCGPIGNNASPVSMFNNTTQLMIVDGVGGWLVPGGYPLSGGMITDAGGLYQINDTITLIGTTGTASAFPILTVTGVISTPVSAYALVNAGTTYSTATNVATTAIQGQPGAGTGLTLNLTTSGGVVTSAAVNAGGTNYVVGDTGLIKVGTQDAVYRVKTASAGAVTAVILLFGGTTYTNTSGAATAAAPGVTANAGLGFKLNITAASGPISASTLAAGGQGYTAGNVGFVSGGTGDATYRITAVGLNGAVSAFTITQGGALVETPASFTQKATSGSGAGFTLGSPSFASFLGLVPITLPFPNPVVGASSDGFGLLVFQGLQAIAQSDEADLSTWEPLNYGIADQSSDNCMAVAVIHDEAYVLKQRNTEVWVDQGTAGFAFQSLTGVHMEYGCAAPYSVAKIGEALAWLARNDQGQGLVVLVKAYAIEIISTQSLTNVFDGYATIGDAIGYAYQQGGHVFYVLVFPQANATWQYDMTASALAGYPIWSRLAAWSDGTFNRHWGNCFWNWSGVPAPVAAPAAPGQVVDFFDVTAITGDGTVFSAPLTTGLFSVWIFNPGPTSAQMDIEVIDGPGNFLQITPDYAANTLSLSVFTSSATVVTATFPLSSAACTNNLLISFDLVHSKLQLYANDAVVSPTTLTWTSPGAVTFVGASSQIRNGWYPILVNGFASNLWLGSTAAFVDLSVTANRRLFINADLSEVALGSNGQTPFGTAPQIFLSVATGAAASTWTANKGTAGGTLSVFSPGTLTLNGNPCPATGPASTATPSGPRTGVLGDYLTGNLYAFNPTNLTDNGTPKRWRRRWRGVAQGSPVAKRFSSLVISMQTGSNVPNTANPQLMLRWSDDGGQTWSDQRIQPAGRLGQTTQSIKFNRLGMTRRFGASDRFFELTSDDQFQVAIIDAEVDVS